MIKKIISFILLILVLKTTAALQPNLLISRFKPIFASFPGSPTALVNGKFGETSWRVSDSSWAAIKLEAGPEKLLFTWNAINTMWSDVLGQPGNCAEGTPVPTSYRILTSANSTNGSDGTWVIADSVSNNTAAARSHTIDFKGSSWVKMQVLSGTGRIDELEVFDITSGNDDTWFFAGTGITATAFKKPVQRKTFRFYLSDIVKAFDVKVTPAFLRGGSFCVTSAGLAIDISKYLDAAQGISHIAIEIGSVEAQGGDASNVPGFAKSLQTIIDTCKNRGVEPIIARIPAVNQEVTTWQINEEYLKTIDALTKKNGLHPGPDFYTWFLQHPDELQSDGVNPSTRGSANIQRLWAEAVYMLYKNEVAESKK